MANMKVITGSAKSSSGGISTYWGYEIHVEEISTSIVNKTSTVRVSSYVKLLTTTDYISHNVNTSFNCGGQNFSETKFVNQRGNRGDLLFINSHDFVVSNTGTNTNPTIINVSATHTSSYSPPSANASGTYQLSVLAEAPIPLSVSFKEDTDSPVKSLGISDEIFIPYLSKKTATIEYEQKTYPVVRFIIGDINSSFYFESSTKNVAMNFKDTSISYTDDDLTAKMQVFIADQYDLGGGFLVTKNIIPYFTPNLEPSNSNVRRKTDTDTSLIDSKATLTIKGTFYKANDKVGNANALAINYKVWKDGESEPTNYTPLTSGITISGNDIEATKVLDNIDYLSKYHYKLKIEDSFHYTSETSGDIPTGIAVWTEFKDRVDFQKITVKNNNPFEYSSDNEIIVGQFDGENIYRKIFIGDVPSTIGTWVNINSFSNVKKILKIDGTFTGNDNRIMNVSHSENNYHMAISYSPSLNQLQLKQDVYFAKNYCIIIEYIKNNN